MKADARHYASMSNIELINCLAVSGAKIARADQFLLATQQALDETKRAYDEARRAHDNALATTNVEQREREAIQSALAMRGYSLDKMEAYSAKLQAHLIEFERSLELDGGLTEAESSADAEEGAAEAPAAEQEDGIEADEDVSSGTEPEGAREEAGETSNAYSDEDREGGDPIDGGDSDADQGVEEVSVSGTEIEESPSTEEAPRLPPAIAMEELKLEIDIDDSPHVEIPQSEPAATAGTERGAYLTNARELALGMTRHPQDAGRSHQAKPLPDDIVVEHFDKISISEEVHAADGQRRASVAKPRQAALPAAAPPDHGGDEFAESGFASRRRSRAAEDDEVGSPQRSGVDDGVARIANTAPGIKV